ncbi:MAG TPA: pyridoxal-phosphate dependent enzyme, partial [Burkholderiales bacterium]|nr:pyridoxal-phosphate dependent enzyme [Burkholderiales bacterium]
LLRNREIGRMPRLYGVQAANCAPYYAAFRAGVEHFTPVAVSPTVAEGIASSKPTRMREVLAPVRASGGEIVAVAEDEIVRALAGLARKGFYVEPTSAAAAAGLSQLIARGAIRPGETTVLVLTGTGLKASEQIGKLLNLGARYQ